MATEDFKQLTDIEHILLRPNMYCGSTVLESHDMFVSGKFTSIEVVPALLKCINELIDNAIDEHIRTNGKFARNINIIMNESSFQIEDDGRGIPVEKYNDVWRPELCWCNSRAGTSFSSDRDTLGANGVGSMICNVFSKLFIGTTCDGKKTLTITCTDNISTRDVKIENTKGKKGTKVYCEPDFQRFGVLSFSKNDIDVIESRITTLAYIYKNKITFSFNNSPIKFKKDDDFLKMFGESYETTVSSTGVRIAVFPSTNDDYIQYSVINALELSESGSVDGIIARDLSSTLREIIKKKNKVDCTIPEIKKGICLVVIGDGFVDMKFSSQSKTKITNSETEVRHFLGDVDYDKLAKKIFVNEDIISPIVELKLARVEAAEKRANTLAQKKMKSQYIEKHIPAKSRHPEEKVLFLCEGDSAIGRLNRVRDVNTQGGFPLRGKVKNVFGMKEKDILANKELSNVMAILGLKFGMTELEMKTELNYGKILILTDADLDGRGHITSLLVNFFALWPELFKLKKVYTVETPLYIFKWNKGKKNERRKYYYSKAEYDAALAKNENKGAEVRYCKGLGTLTVEEYRDSINDKSRWYAIDLDDPKCLEIMFGNDVISRRKIMEI